MFENQKKEIWEMNIEEQQKYYDQQTEEFINAIVSKIIRNRITFNTKLREKIKNTIDKIIKEELNDLL